MSSVHRTQSICVLFSLPVFYHNSLVYISDFFILKTNRMVLFVTYLSNDHRIYVSLWLAVVCVEQISVNGRANSSKRSTLEDLFRPPLDLLHKGSFKSVSFPYCQCCKSTIFISVVNSSSVKNFIRLETKYTKIYCYTTQITLTFRPLSWGLHQDWLPVSDISK